MLGIFISIIIAIISSFKEANSDIELSKKLPNHNFIQNDISQLYKIQFKKALIKNCSLFIIEYIFIEKLIDCMIEQMNYSFLMKDALVDYAINILKNIF